MGDAGATRDKMPDAIRFNLANPAFIDFGCGTGNSMKFAQSVMKAPGIGLDRSADAVAACVARGFEAHACDMLDFEQRSCAQATFAVDCMPELGSRREFERGWVNIVRAARDFSIMQHISFDYDDMLAARGEEVPAGFHKAIRYKPRISDYIHLVATHRAALNIVGLGIFGSGEVAASPIGLPGLNATHFAMPDGMRMHRSIRVILGRKDVARFRHALQRAATGDALVLWEMG